MSSDASEKISLICAWIETALWGLNSIVFLGTCWILFLKPNSRGNRVMLGTTSAVLYLVATINVSATLRQLLEAFIYVPSSAITAAPGQPTYASTYFLDETRPMALLKNVLYCVAVLTQNFVLIWRLYVVWGHDWRFAVVPLIAELCRSSIGFTGVALLSGPSGIRLAKTIRSFAIAAWSLDIAMQVTVTAAIALRLWYMGRMLYQVSSSLVKVRNTYLTAITTIVESGALSAVVSIVLLILNIRNSPAGLPAVTDGCQLTVLIPLMIIVRVGLGLTHSLPSAYKSYLETTMGQESITFAPQRKPVDLGSRINVHREVTTDDMNTTTELTNEMEMSDLKLTH
ncbi:hypothetical protein CERSUDRAFT_124685 [Gelatoporia subvermispora B]|uniref:Uncharacterized protein n=1 Tax=Ceriporiopsis subvermispora (strain B) TaxID=914234 RepID=M2R9B6_CERS8|nr:hypothetical protein CERSUDRAFT_124685 [Gelatoporia subvermispora B]